MNALSTQIKYICDGESFARLTSPGGVNYTLDTEGRVIFPSVKMLRDYINEIHGQLYQRIAVLELNEKAKTPKD